MNCPTCGSILKEHQSPKGAVFLTCSQWPQCKVSGTPELLERFEQVSEESSRQTKPCRGPVPLGLVASGLAQLRIHQARLKRAKTAEERERIRKQALEAIR